MVRSYTAVLRATTDVNWFRAAKRNGHARALDFGDGEFDVLINNYMFDLLPDDDFDAILAGFRRVLRPGGRIVVAGMTRGDLEPKHTLLGAKDPL